MITWNLFARHCVLGCILLTGCAVEQRENVDEQESELSQLPVGPNGRIHPAQVPSSVTEESLIALGFQLTSAATAQGSFYPDDGYNVIHVGGERYTTFRGYASGAKLTARQYKRGRTNAIVLQRGQAFGGGPSRVAYLFDDLATEIRHSRQAPSAIPIEFVADDAKADSDSSRGGYKSLFCLDGHQGGAQQYDRGSCTISAKLDVSNVRVATTGFQVQVLADLSVQVTGQLEGGRAYTINKKEEVNCAVAPLTYDSPYASEVYCEPRRGAQTHLLALAFSQAGLRGLIMNNDTGAVGGIPFALSAGSPRVRNMLGTYLSPLAFSYSKEHTGFSVPEPHVLGGVNRGWRGLAPR